MNLNMVFVLHFLAIFTLSTANRCLFNTPTYDFTVGKIGATIISDGPIEIQTNRFLVPKQAVEKSYEALFRSSSPLQWASNIVLLDTPAGRILVDTGAFNTPQFAFSQRSGQLRRNLEAAGVSRGSIAGIFITHGHPDHVAGLVTRAGKRAFKNARLYISRQEHEFWMNVPPVSENDTSQDAEGK